MNIEIFDDRDQSAHNFKFFDEVVLGRQRTEDPDPIQHIEHAKRIVVVGRTDRTISREHFRLSIHQAGINQEVIRVENLSSIEQQIKNENLAPGESRDFSLPLSFKLGDLQIFVAAERSYRTLPHMTAAPGTLNLFREAFAKIEPTDEESEKRLVSWLGIAMDVLQNTATSPVFMQKAATAVKEIVKLDRVAILVNLGNSWVPRCITDTEATGAWRPSQTVLEYVASQKRTLFNFEELTQGRNIASLNDVSAVVASPILAADGRVLGILYGDRKARGGNPPVISEVEAMLVDVLTYGVAAGLARVSQEHAALKARTQFEQFFGRELTEILESNPTMLDGRVEQITSLFCDISGFSTASEQLDAAKTIEWVGAIMNQLHHAVIENQGVVVDYIGDALIAMWGAPKKAARYADQACNAAIQMVESINNLNRSGLLVIPAAVTVGINSGEAHVGNIGTPLRFKYGPLGDSVNLASRLQGANKHLGSSILISRKVKELLTTAIPHRRLGLVKVVNISRSIEVFEVLAGKPDEELANRKAGLESALELFESGKTAEAAMHLESHLARFKDDRAAIELLKHFQNPVNTSAPADQLTRILDSK